MRAWPAWILHLNIMSCFAEFFPLSRWIIKTCPIINLLRILLNNSPLHNTRQEVDWPQSCSSQQLHFFHSSQMRTWSLQPSPQWLKDISTPDFSTPNFNPRHFNPRLFNHELFNPGLFNPGHFNHEFFDHGVEKFMIGKSGVKMSFNLLERWHFNPGVFNSRIFNHELFNPMVKKFMVQGWKVHMVEKSGVESSGVEAWGWKVWDWDVLQPKFWLW